MKLHTLLLLIIFALLSSCTDDPIDEEGPSITIHSPEDLTVLLRNRVRFKIEASDNATVSKIEFFVDGSLLQSADGAEMQVFWDTQRIEDGSHTVRIVAEDISGNQGERSIQVEVKNDLFTFRIGANYIRGGEEVWIFVNDSVGNPIGVKRVLTNIDVVKINTPEGHKSNMQYTVNFINYAKAAEISGTKENFILTSYVNLSSMDFVLDNEIRARPASPIGIHNLIVHSSPTYPPKRGVLGADAFIAGFEGTLPALGQLVIPISAALTKSPSDVMYFIHENDKPAPKFIRFPAATAGNSEVVEYSALEVMRSSSIILPEIANYSYFAIATVSKKGDFVNFRPFIDQANLQSSVLVTMFLPEVEFPDYLTEIGYNTDNSINNYLVAGAIPAEYKAVNADITSLRWTPKNVVVLSSGKADYITVSSYESVKEGADTRVFDWLVIAPQMTKSEIPAVRIPLQVFEAFPAILNHTFYFDGAAVVEKSGVDSYEEWVRLRYSGANPFLTSKESSVRRRYFNSSGGRKRSLQSRTERRMDDWEYWR